MKLLTDKTNTAQVLTMLCALFAGLLLNTMPVYGQQIMIRPQGLVRGGIGVMIPGQSTASSDEIIDGASLKTDPELESILEKAERYRADGNYIVATKLWQAVLERSGDALYSEDNQSYYSLVQQVERIIAGLPADGLEKYRNSADASAKEILAQANGEFDMNALNKVVREYFISSLGDDAAFTLGCVYLDKFDFIGARRMFEKIIRQYPDPSVPVDEVLARIALCQSFMGDIESAKQTLDLAIKNSPGGSLLITEVRDTLGKISKSQQTSAVSGKWLMRMGNSRRYGVMPSLPFEFTGKDMVARWQYFIEPQDFYNRSTDAAGKFVIAQKFDAAKIKDTRTSAEINLIKEWKEKNWRPSGHVLIDNNKIYYKTAADLVAFDLEKVGLAPTRPDDSAETLWRSVWRNSFTEDDATRMMAAIRQSWSSYGRRQGVQLDSDNPSTTSEVLLFGDTIHQQMSISDGVLYAIEGHRFDKDNRTPKKAVTPQWNASFRRTRSNFLTAYDSETGLALWTLPRKVEQVNEGIGEELKQQPWIEGGGFMSSPIGYGETILAAVNQGGSIYVYSLDPKNEGKTIWKSFLCDEPDSSASPWSPINLSINGSDLFVTCGMGVVFVLDPATGLVRFAKRYEREGQFDNAFRRLGWTSNRKIFDGWSEDVVIPYGREMICFSSDTQEIIAIDRNTGEMIWKNTMDPRGYRIDYLLGIYDDKMYAAGRETVVAFDLQGEGLSIWGGEQVFGGRISKGRGMLTPGGIYVPVEDAIYKLDLKGNGSSAKVVAKAGVKLGTDAPVGNLFSDGKRIWVHGGTRLYGLWPDDSVAKKDNDNEANENAASKDAADDEKKKSDDSDDDT